MRFVFTPWRSFSAQRDRTVDRRFLDAAAHEFEDTFKVGLAGSKTGVKYPHLPNRSSAPGEYPANQSGALRGSIRTVLSPDSMVGGSNVFYSVWLRGGSSKMSRRKMSDDAMREAVPKVTNMLHGFVHWKNT